MKCIRTGRATLAIVFIALGFIILFRNIIGYNLISLCPILWPFILMVFGMELIVNNYKSTKDKNLKSKLDILSTSVVLGVLSIIISIPFVAELKKIGKDYFKQNYKQNEIISQDIVLKKYKKLTIEDNYSDIIVNESKDENIKVTVETIYKHNDEKSIDIKEKSNVKIIRQNDTVKITTNISTNLKNKGLYNHIPIKNKYILWIPSNMLVEIINNYGSVKLKDIENDINIKSNYCKTNVENVIGEVYISSNGGNINYKADRIIDKNIEIYCDYGNINIEFDKNQYGKFNIVTNYGNIYDDLGFNIIDSASNSSINETVGKLDPKINIRVSKGNIKIKGR